MWRVAAHCHVCTYTRQGHQALSTGRGGSRAGRDSHPHPRPCTHTHTYTHMHRRDTCTTTRACVGAHMGVFVCVCVYTHTWPVLSSVVQCLPAPLCPHPHPSVWVTAALTTDQGADYRLTVSYSQGLGGGHRDLAWPCMQTGHTHTQTYTHTRTLAV